MKKLRVTLKNYRAFTDEDPLRIEIGPGFTAIVGKNNSGKSAAKLFFYEFRQLFKALSNPIGSSPSLGSIVGSGQTVVDYLGVTDVEEVFCNSNSRPATIEFEIAEAASYRLGADCLTRVTASCDRSNRNWSFAAFGKEAPNTNLLNAQKTPRGTAGENILLFGNDTLDCTDFRQVFKCLGEAKYYGPFRNAINQGAGEHYDLRVGTSFIDLWREWKTSGVKQKSRAIDQVTEEIRRLFEFDRLEISASDQLKTLIVSVNGQPYLLSELGSGLAQFIMVLGNAATSPPTILFIDEPETNLHPALQIDFLLSLARYASEGVVFSTHSVGLARSVAEAIYTAQRKGTSTIFRPFEATPNYMEFIGELSFSTFKDLGSDRILLVEGVNDVKTVQQLLRLYGKDHTTVILPLGGDQLTSGREMELSELTRLSGNICAIVDSERNNSGGAAKASRQDFEQVCKKIGIKSCVTERRALENYFTDRSVKAALGDSYVALTPFQKLKDAARPWSKVENWKIARQMEISELESSDVGVFLASI